MEEKDCRVKPFVVDGKLKCSKCGTGRMRTNRTRCFECGAEFIAEPWSCSSCGTEHLYRLAACEECGTPTGFEIPVYVEETEPAKQASYTATEKRTYTTTWQPRQLKPSHPLKWYYFLIYGLLIMHAVSYFLSVFVELVNGQVVLSLFSVIIGSYALVTRSRLKHKRKYAPIVLYVYFILSYGFDIVRFFTTLENMLGESGVYDMMQSLPSEGIAEVNSLLSTMKSGVIAGFTLIAVVMLLCNAIYFKRRKDMFVN